MTVGGAVRSVRELEEELKRLKEEEKLVDLSFSEYKVQ